MPMYGAQIVQNQAQIPPQEQQLAYAIANQRGISCFPYYSTVKWQPTRTATAPGFTYTLQRGAVVEAFSYARGETGLNAGFAAADGNMTLSETNLQDKHETIAGEAVTVHGLAIMLKHGSIPAATDAGVSDARYLDSRLLAQLSTNVSVELGLNGDQNRYPLGTMQMIPGAGGISGAGVDNLGTQAIPGGRPIFHFPSNGWPVASNYKRIPEGLNWMPKPCADASLSILFTVTRAIALRSGGDPENAADSVAAAGGPPITLQAYVYPTVLQNLWGIHLIGTTVNPRTRVK